MVVGDLFKVFRGEIRVFNKWYEEDVGIVNTKFFTWVKLSYLNCEVESLELEMLNTAVLSARIVVNINDEHAGQDSGDVEEATKQDIKDLMDSIYNDDGKIPTDKEAIDVITDDYFDDQPLDGDDKPKPWPPYPPVPPAPGPHPPIPPHPVPPAPKPPAPESEDEDIEEATAEDIADLLGGIYDE